MLHNKVQQMHRQLHASVFEVAIIVLLLIYEHTFKIRNSVIVDIKMLYFVNSCISK